MGDLALAVHKGLNGAAHTGKASGGVPNPAQYARREAGKAWFDCHDAGYRGNLWWP